MGFPVFKSLTPALPVYSFIWLVLGPIRVLYNGCPCVLWVISSLLRCLTSQWKYATGKHHERQQTSCLHPATVNIRQCTCDLSDLVWNNKIIVHCLKQICTYQLIFPNLINIFLFLYMYLSQSSRNVYIDFSESAFNHIYVLLSLW